MVLHDVYIYIFSLLSPTGRRNFIQTSKKYSTLKKYIPKFSELITECFKIQRKDLMKVSYRYFVEIILDGYVNLVTPSIVKTFKSMTRHDICKILFGLAVIGNLDMIKCTVYHINRNVMYEKSVMYGAANSNNIEILKWGMEHNFVYDQKTYVYAAENNHTDCILLLTNNTRKISESTVREIKKMGNAYMIDWMCSHMHLVNSYWY